MNTRKQQGFTIIEVVLVLAIAGLIFLMVFIALPALQRGQRDNGRKNDVSTVASAVNTFRSNNKATLTGMDSAKIQGYIDKLTQFDVTQVTVGTPASPVTTATDSIVIIIGAKCGGAGSTPTQVTYTATGSTRQAAILTGLENNGSTVVGYCQDV